MNMKGRLDMKQLKKFVLILMCTGMMMGLTACSSTRQTEENGAVKDNTTTTEDANTNSATEDNNKDGVADQIGDDIQNGVDDVKDSMKEDANTLKEKANDMTSENNNTNVKNNQ